ncbi:hypothetical protein HG15A2_20280 [Adhaeretor mobilis]|uniref:Uncharacterized protein n=2 Tax=Adhaeretor mobilis TaxID=1930276 RepID=A0A517MV44_9BACT|nr:hypothetical protein HG15A2_20280 [Adhaeretor mobilis]
MIALLRPGYGRIQIPLRTLCDLLAIGLVALGLCATTLQAAESGSSATTSDEARNEARQAIPLARIHRDHRDKVSMVLSDPSLYRRLPTDVVDCQPEMFTFLAQNPEVLVEIWRKLGVSNVQLIRTGPYTFDLTDGMGTTGTLAIVEQLCEDRAQNRVVMYSEGSYEGRPFKRPVTANCVLLLRSGSMTETNGRPYVAARLDTFVRLNRPSMELLARAVHPFVGKTTDRNFVDTMNFVGNLSYAAERRPESIAQLSDGLENIGPARRQKFVQVAHQCSQAGSPLREARADSKTAQR